MTTAQRPMRSRTRTARRGQRTPRSLPTNRWLHPARVLWIAVVAPAYALWIAQLPAYDAAARDQRAPGGTTPRLDTLQLRAADLERLHAWGLSLDVYVVGVIALTLLFHLTYAAAGMLLFWRRADQWIAFIASFALMMLPFGFAPLTLASLPPDWRWIIPAVAALGNGSLLFCGFVFPDGRFAPRWVGGLAILLVAYSLVSATVSGAQLDHSSLSVVIFLAFALSVVPIQVYRYRTLSSPFQRQQTKWVVLGIVAGVLGNIAARVFYVVVLVPQWGASTLAFVAQVGLTMVAMLAIPLTVGSAIFSSHLWDIDLVIRKTMLYSVLSSLLAAIYAATVIVLQTLIHPFTGLQRPGPLVITASTLLVAATTNPLRRWLQNVIDRRFYRRKYRTERVLTAFTEALRGEVELSQLRQRLLSVIDETMQPSHLSLWLAPTREQQAAGPRVPLTPTAPIELLEPIEPAKPIEPIKPIERERPPMEPFRVV